jgi:cobalt transporter subunit CbtB
MPQTPSIDHTSKKVFTLSKNNQIITSALLGFTILMAVGFSPIEVIHNATHDARHSAGFPCH